MYTTPKFNKTTIKAREVVEGETIEQKIERIMENGEPITDGAPLIYTERKDGVLAGYNIKTDRFDVAIDAMDKVDKTNKAKREERHNPKIVKIDGTEPDSKGDNSAKNT